MQITGKSELLSYTKEACEIYNSATMTLEEVIEVMRKAESESKMVVRLAYREPSLYGAVREQMDCLDELGISYESCGSFHFALVQLHLCRSNIHCRRSHRALLLPAWQKTSVPEKESIESFAAHQASMAIYLSTGMLEELSRRLVAVGIRKTPRQR